MDLLCICVSKFLSEPAKSTTRSSPDAAGKCNSKMQCDLEDASGERCQVDPTLGEVEKKKNVLDLSE